MKLVGVVVLTLAVMSPSVRKVWIEIWFTLVSQKQVTVVTFRKEGVD